MFQFFARKIYKNTHHNSLIFSSFQLILLFCKTYIKKFTLDNLCDSE
jgi:hypothetical protein